MLSEEFDLWAKHHAAIFALSEKFVAETMSQWFHLFAAAGYTARELLEASEWLTTHNPPQKTWDHLGAVQARIRSVRAVDYRRQVDSHDNDRGTCSLCSGTGRVVVPHLAGVEGDKWVSVKVARSGSSYYTQAVFCCCALGNWYDSRNSDDKRPMRLEAYEVRNPNWRQQMKARDREQGHEARLKRSPEPWVKMMARLEQMRDELAESMAEYS